MLQMSMKNGRLDTNDLKQIQDDLVSRITSFTKEE